MIKTKAPGFHMTRSRVPGRKCLIEHSTLGLKLPSIGEQESVRWPVETQLHCRKDPRFSFRHMFSRRLFCAGIQPMTPLARYITRLSTPNTGQEIPAQSIQARTRAWDGHVLP
jgi:hypothetical protein